MHEIKVELIYHYHPKKEILRPEPSESYGLWLSH